MSLAFNNKRTTIITTNAPETNTLENNAPQYTQQLLINERKPNVSNEVLLVTNFETVKQHSDKKLITNDSSDSSDSSDSRQNSLEVLNTLPQITNTTPLLEGGTKDIIVDIDEENNDKDEKDEKESALPEENTKEKGEANNSKGQSPELLGGSISDGIIYEIEFLVIDDKELINITKINSVVDKYINNFYSEEMKKYKQSFKNLYQKYSNKRYIINNIGYVITVMKNDIKNQKKKDIVVELKKPQYMYYDNNGNLDILKRKISNDRVELHYLYQTLLTKLNVYPDEKKDFEKQRHKFIESLETYYIYTLYHRKINKISTTNKINITIQELLGDNNIVEGNIYSVDNVIIDLINKQNASKLNEFNNLISKMQSIKNIKNDNTILDIIKEYLNKNETNKLLETLKIISKQQDNYINYIITELP